MRFPTAASAYLWACRVRDAHRAGSAQTYEPRGDGATGQVGEKVLEAYQVIKSFERICDSTCRGYSPECLLEYLETPASERRRLYRRADPGLCLRLLELALIEKGMVDPSISKPMDG